MATRGSGMPCDEPCTTGAGLRSDGIELLRRRLFLVALMLDDFTPLAAVSLRAAAAAVLCCVCERATAGTGTEALRSLPTERERRRRF